MVDNDVITVFSGVKLEFECTVTGALLNATTLLDFGDGDIVTNMKALRSFTFYTIVTCTGSNDLGSASFHLNINVTSGKSCPTK